jgi:hypothetical protein
VRFQRRFNRGFEPSGFWTPSGLTNNFENIETLTQEAITLLNADWFLFLSEEDKESTLIENWFTQNVVFERERIQYLGFHKYYFDVCNQRFYLIHTTIP